MERTSAPLRELAAELAAAGPGRAYLLRKRRDRLFAEEYARVSARILDDVVTRLAALSDAVQPEAVAPDAALAAAPTRPLVLKAAFLVPAALVESFSAVADELTRLSEVDGLLVEVSGPWAPYSFVGEARP